MGKRFGIAAVIVLFLVLVGYGGFWFLFERTPQSIAVSAPEAAPIAMGDDLQRIKVVQVEGQVERHKEGAEWSPVQAGDELGQHEAIRTGEGARATLDLGKTATVELAAQSEASVQEITQAVARVRLDQGRMGAVVHEGAAGTLRVETQGSDATAESQGGEFSVLANGSGQLAVATKTGRVRLSAKNQTVEVPAGTQSVAFAGESPGAAEPIPASLFLKVARPDQLELREAQTTIDGTTTSGAVVAINGVHVSADNEGKFRATINLKEGANAVVVTARDVIGRTERSDLPEILVDTRAPDLKRSRVQWGAK